MSATSRPQPHPVTTGVYLPQLQPPPHPPPSVASFAFVTRKPPPGYSDSSTYSMVAPST